MAATYAEIHPTSSCEFKNHPIALLFGGAIGESPRRFASYLSISPHLPDYANITDIFLEQFVSLHLKNRKERFPAINPKWVGRYLTQLIRRGHFRLINESHLTRGTFQAFRADIFRSLVNYPQQIFEFPEAWTQDIVLLSSENTIPHEIQVLFDKLATLPGFQSKNNGIVFFQRLSSLSQNAPQAFQELIARKVNELTRRPD